MENVQVRMFISRTFPTREGPSGGENSCIHGVSLRKRKREKKVSGSQLPETVKILSEDSFILLRMVDW